MRLDASVVGLKEAIAALDDVAKRHVPFATSIAINRTLEESLIEGRKEIQANMVVRVPNFILPPIMLPNAVRATKTRLEGTAAFGYPDVLPNNIGDRREKILRKFEYGGMKEAADPDKPIAIPSSALRPTPTASIARAFYPVNLGLAPRQGISGETIGARRRGAVKSFEGKRLSNRARKQQGLEGLLGTFTMQDEQGRPIGVFQRVGHGRGREGRRVLWWFEHSIHIPRLIHFTDIAPGVIHARFATNWNEAMEHALSTAR